MKWIRSPEKISEGTCRGFGPRKIIPNSRADQYFLNWVSGSGYTVKIFLVIQILCILNIIYLFIFIADSETEIQNASQVGRNKVIEIRNAYGWSVQV